MGAHVAFMTGIAVDQALELRHGVGAKASLRVVLAVFPENLALLRAYGPARRGGFSRRLFSPERALRERRDARREHGQRDQRQTPWRHETSPPQNERPGPAQEAWPEAEFFPSPIPRILFSRAR